MNHENQDTKDQIKHQLKFDKNVSKVRKLWISHGVCDYIAQTFHYLKQNTNGLKQYTAFVQAHYSDTLIVNDPDVPMIQKPICLKDGYPELKLPLSQRTILLENPYFSALNIVYLDVVKWFSLSQLNLLFCNGDKNKHILNVGEQQQLGAFWEKMIWFKKMYVCYINSFSRGVLDKWAFRPMRILWTFGVSIGNNEPCKNIQW